MTRRSTNAGEKKRTRAGRKKRASTDTNEQAGAGTADAAAQQPAPADRPDSAPMERGEGTRAIIALAGIDAAVAKKRRWGMILAGVVTLLVATIALDLAGVIEIPGVGLRHRVGLAPPRKQPVAASGRPGVLSAPERRRMRRSLLGGGDTRGSARPRSHEAASASKRQVAGERQAAAERQVAADIFASDDKPEVRLEAPAGEGIRLQRLPDGLSAKAVSDVIAENSSSAALCLAESMRRSAVPPGRMEIEITIEPSGKVSDARIITSKYSGTRFATCVARRIRNWRFPSFSGDAVTVVYPYIVSSQM